MVRTLREVFKADRERLVLSTGAYNLLVGHLNIRRTLEKRLRQLREEGKVRHVGLSCHDRKFVGALADEGAIDVAMMRYNAAHRGAEQDIFPYLERHNTGVVSYTATRWRYLIKRPRGWPKGGRIPTAGECYRFVLSNPHVHVCLTAPSNLGQLEENIAAFEQGPLSDQDMKFMMEFGDVVHDAGNWFM